MQVTEIDCMDQTVALYMMAKIAGGKIVREISYHYEMTRLSAATVSLSGCLQFKVTTKLWMN